MSARLAQWQEEPSIHPAIARVRSIPVDPRADQTGDDGGAPGREKQQDQDVEKGAVPRDSNEQDVEVGSAKDEEHLDALPPPPNGGAQAWLQTLCAHMTAISSWGQINAYGAFTPYYVQRYGRSVADVNWIASTAIALLFGCGVLSGRLTDAGRFRPVFLAGSICIVAGVFLASIAKTYWQSLLSHGVLCGIGNGLVFCSSLTVVSAYWSTRKSLALGLSACGSSVGGLCFPLLTKYAAPKIGYPWCLRIIGFIVLAMLSFCNVFFKPRLPPRQTGPLVEWSAFTESLVYPCFCLGMFLNFLGLYYGFFDVGLLGQYQAGATREQQQLAVIVLSVVGIHSRIIPNFLADRIGPMNLLIPACVAGGIVMLSFNAVHNVGGYFGILAIYGSFGAAIQSLFPAALVRLSPEPSKTGVRMGMCFSVLCFATLIGSPIAGVIISAQHGSFVGANAFAGCCLLAGATVLFASRTAKVGLVLRARM